jgi:hypothetical protein
LEHDLPVRLPAVCDVQILAGVVSSIKFVDAFSPRLVALLKALSTNTTTSIYV